MLRAALAIIAVCLRLATVAGVPEMRRPVAAGPSATVRWSGAHGPAAMRLVAREVATMETLRAPRWQSILGAGVGLFSLMVVGAPGAGAQEGTPAAGFDVPAAAECT